MNPRVLVVEDDPAIRALLTIALHREHISVDGAGDGLAALDKIASTRYDVLLVDLMMPKMDGFTLLESIGRLPLTPRPVVFVMTAYDDSVFGKLDPSVVHGLLRKPFDIESVATTVRDCAVLLQEHLPSTAGNDRRDTAPPRALEPPLRVLVAEDDADYRAWIVALTRRIGCSVDPAQDGLEAFELLMRNSYDIAVIDHDMPRLNGVDLIARMRENDRTATVYAVMLTAADDMDAKLRALGAGFDDFLGKGSPEAEIVAKLGVARRIAARQRRMDTAVRELRGLATRDELTGVFNRRVFVAETERLLAQGTALSIVLFDLDDFKVVNDTYGHIAGDRVLRDVGAVFYRNTRPEDLIARYGGDEFVMIVPHLDVPHIESLAHRLAREVRALQWSVGSGEPFTVGVTTGMASSRLLAEPTVTQLLDAADRDLYKNKWMRRNPNENPELYEYPHEGRPVDLLLMRKPEERRESDEDEAAETAPPPPPLT
jgi:two-component system, cell cycle response regulator